MSGVLRGVVAVPSFLLYSAAALFVGGTGGIGGVALMALGAVGAGYLVGSSWALLIAAPFTVYGVLAIANAGPHVSGNELTDTGWGVLILLALALPVAACAGFGILLRRRART
jgi:hypothetical protein